MNRLLLDLHQRHPRYGFDRHKGYPTADHLAAVRQWGACEAHRRSFAPVRQALSQGPLAGPPGGGDGGPVGEGARP